MIMVVILVLTLTEPCLVAHRSCLLLYTIFCEGTAKYTIHCVATFEICSRYDVVVMVDESNDTFRSNYKLPRNCDSVSHTQALWINSSRTLIFKSSKSDIFDSTWFPERKIGRHEFMWVQRNGYRLHFVGISSRLFIPDMTKAFDSVAISTVLSAAHEFGIRGVLLKRLRSYLIYTVR